MQGTATLRFAVQLHQRVRSRRSCIKKQVVRRGGVFEAPSAFNNTCWCCKLQILETKVRKLEQLIRLKDLKLQTLTSKLQKAGLAD